MFRAYENKGFQITFANQYTVSVMFGMGNYCEHKMSAVLDCHRAKGSKNAEVVLFDDINDKAKLLPNSYCVGWCSPEKVGKIIAVVAEYKREDGELQLKNRLKEAIG